MSERITLATNESKGLWESPTFNLNLLLSSSDPFLVSGCPFGQRNYEHAVVTETKKLAALCGT
jgi:hypothetical protein